MIYIFDIISRLQFLFHHRKTWSILELHDSKMAEGNDLNLDFLRGRARVLIELIEYFERRREVMDLPPPVGRAGLTPKNLTNRNTGSTGTCGWREEDQIQRGRAGAPGMICNLRGRDLGGLSTWTGKGRGQGFSQNSPVQSPFPTTPLLSERRSRGRALAPPSPHPLRTIPLQGGTKKAL